jgi:hypothetical protein
VALSDKPTRATIRSWVRAELNDPTGTAPWSWPDAELNQYIDEHQQRLQDTYEFVWSVATAIVQPVGVTTSTINGPSNGMLIPAGTASITLNTFIPNALRCDAFYWITSTTTFQGIRLAARNKQDLDLIVRDWRYVIPSDPPLVVYQDDINNIVLWPAPAVMGTLIAEFPAKLCFATDTSTMQIPAWTKYSARNYCAYRALLRTGPNQNIQRALTYKKLWLRQYLRYRRMWDAYFPDKYPQLKPTQNTDHYVISILNPPYITIIPP